MKSHTYFISGGCGFLGQHIVKAIHDHDSGAEMRVLDLCPRPTLLGIESLDGVKVVAGDLRQPYTFIDQLRRADTVVHCAGVISFNGNSADPSCKANIVSMQNLLQVALDHNCQNFIYISSISTVDSQPGRISDETMIPDIEGKRLSDPYGFSKLIGECALLAEKDRIRGIILNPSVILGPGSPLIEKILLWLRWIPFCPMITNMNSFVDVRDVAQAVVLALTEGISSERYIVTSENMDNLTFISMVLAVMGNRAPVFPVPKALFPIYDFVALLLDAMHLKEDLKKSSDIVVDKAYCNGKIRREMGWQPKYTMEQSLRHMILTSQERDEAKGQDHLAYRGL